MGTIFEEQPHDIQFDSSSTDTSSTDDPMNSSSANHLRETRKSGFTCNFCASSVGEDVASGLCGLAALALILTLFIFDKEETTGVLTSESKLDEGWLREVLETITESSGSQGECRQSIDHLLKTPLFHESLSLSRHTWLTYESSLGEAVSSAFRDVEAIRLSEEQPVAVVITRSSEGGESELYDSAAVAVAVRLRRSSSGRFALVGCHDSKGSSVGFEFYESTAAMCQQLENTAQPADSLYILTPGAACRLPFGTHSSAASAQPEMHTSRRGGEEPTSEMNITGITHSAALQDSTSTLSVFVPDSISGEGSSAQSPDTHAGDDITRANSPPPPYVIEDPAPLPSEEASLSRVTANFLSPHLNGTGESSASPDVSSDALGAELQAQSGPDLSTTVPRNAPKLRKPVQVNRDFEWMHALQTSGPIIHPPPTPASSQETSRIMHSRKAQKKVRIGQPVEKRRNSQGGGSSALQSEVRETRTHASNSTATSSNAPQSAPSNSSSSTYRLGGPHFYDTNQLDLLFTAPKKRTRGDAGPSNQLSSFDAERAAAENSFPTASECHDEAVDDGTSFQSALSPKAAMKQKERVNTESSKRRDFEWQLQLMGTSKMPTSSSDSGFKAPSSSNGASESLKYRQSGPGVPWSPLMLRPELVELDGFLHRSYGGDDHDAGGSPSSSTRQPNGWDEDPSPRQTKSFKASRNDIAWQLALVSTVLRPSEEYMRQQEKRFIQLNPRYRPEKFDCLICFETIAGPDGSRMMNCEHSFCRDCMTGHVRSQLEENLYPIICPVCFPDPERTARGFVDDYVLDELDLTQKELDKFEDLQLAAVIVKIDCPGCKQVLVVAREDYLNEPFLTCNLPGCSSRFCRACLMVMVGEGEEHTCKVDEELDALMTANGWRYCPGCRTPILKESGCNHMTCKSPGCTTHFCYVCGDSIWDATSLESLNVLLNAHYRHCNQFDPDPPAGARPGGPRRGRRGDCVIQ